VEFIDVDHVVFLLERDVDNGVGDFLADAVEELGFTDDNAEFGVEVDFVASTTLGIRAQATIFKNRSFQVLNRSGCVLLLPLLVNVVLIHLSQMLRNLHISLR